MESREFTTLSASALGSLIGGILASPLGPWAAVGGATLGTTVGGLVANQLWAQFYLDLRQKLDEARGLLERDQATEAAALLIELRQHPRFADQEAHFRSELEYVLGQVLTGLAQGAETSGDARAALDRYREASLFQPKDPLLLWSSIRLASSGLEPGYDSSGRFERDLTALLALDPRHAAAVRALADLLERTGRLAEASDRLREAARTVVDRPDIAGEHWRTLLRLVPSDPEALGQLAAIELDAGRPREALALLARRAPEASTDTAWQLLLGRASFASGDLPAARACLEPIAKESTEACFYAGLAAAHSGDTRAAEAHLAATVRDPVLGREATLALAGLLLDRGDLEVASNHLEREGLGEAPGYEALLKRLAAAFEARGEEARAALLFDRMRHLGDSSSFWARFALEHRDGAPVVLGHGSAGRVLLGRRRSDRLPVAIREAPAPFAIGGKAALRFTREVSSLGKLSHPNLVSLLGHALPEGKCLLAMEYCAGGSLEEALRAPMLWAQIRSVALAVLDGLGFLSCQIPPIVHRNLKPSNILFTADGAVKLGDFSLARAADGSGTSVVSSIQDRAQAVLYQSPEVILGASDVGPPADIYSFGCVLYQMVTGRPPFRHTDVNRQIAAHFEETPAPASSLAAWVPPALDRVLARCLEKDPVNRYSDVDLLRRALDSI